MCLHSFESNFARNHLSKEYYPQINSLWQLSSHNAQNLANNPF